MKRPASPRIKLSIRNRLQGAPHENARALFRNSYKCQLASTSRFYILASKRETRQPVTAVRSSKINLLHTSVAHSRLAPARLPAYRRTSCTTFFAC